MQTLVTTNGVTAIAPWFVGPIITMAIVALVAVFVLALVDNWYNGNKR